MLQLDNISKRYGSRVLFESLSFQFPDAERVALVGANGAGKTTLLRIITGEEEATTGKITMGRNQRIGYLPQEPNRDPKSTVLEECLTGAKEAYQLKIEIEKILSKLETDADEKLLSRLDDLQIRYSAHDGYDIEPNACKILKGLGFSDEVVRQSPTQLSGGWRMRLELAKIFLAKPEVLLLDEPTNHLDLPSLAWVENYLSKYTGTLIFVSHDRPLLNRLATYTVEISPMGLMAFRGNFDKFVTQKEARLEQLAAERAQIGRRKKQLEDFISRFGAKASKAAQAQSKAKMLARLQAIESDLPEEELAATMSLTLPDPQRSSRILLQIENLSIGYGAKILSKNISLVLEKEMKVAIVGANGIGKSTFLKTIFAQIPSLEGEVKLDFATMLAYFAQDQLDYLDSKASILENVMNANAEISQQRARQILGSLLFRGEDIFKKISVLSGGEKNRVGLACMLMKPANLLLLDEPTNHLDMGSVAVLAQALADYKGSMIFVSHDRDFINSVCTHVFVMLADGRYRLFEGDLESYSRLARYSGFPDILSPDWEDKDTKPQSNATDSNSKNKTENRSEQKSKNQKIKKMQDLEKKIDSLKDKIRKLDSEIFSGESMDHFKLLSLTQEKDKLEADLKILEEEWLMLSLEES